MPRRGLRDHAGGILQTRQVGGTPAARPERLRGRVHAEEDGISVAKDGSGIDGEGEVGRGSGRLRALSDAGQDVEQAGLVEGGRIELPCAHAIGVLVDDGDAHGGAFPGDHGGQGASCSYVSAVYIIAGSDPRGASHLRSLRRHRRRVESC